MYDVKWLLHRGAVYSTCLPYKLHFLQVHRFDVLNEHVYHGRYKIAGASAVHLQKKMTFFDKPPSRISG